ncbi:uncharacterized protein N7443_009519 [Penicillium atrosanguineum]|uniref:uncharacterized protein n=1 Tax=Penicillium atrosanguineum TaxID=1132637 RepID=UPI00238A0F4F|nr:uncharacterized protein N7443_009519 [Penicillium atrosanguineum]KAJ5138198.1 hypothetical protein N7526_004431 [Penicillium atrosanguineum]KAJ5289266.1 hypothetical protein N7443_009519 [Penicillium atrosanguineum]
MDTSVSYSNYTFHIPAESDHHAGTIMAWPTERSILDTLWSYPGSDVNQTRHELAKVALAIAKYEQVEMFVLDPSWDSHIIDGKNGSSLETAKQLLGDAKNVTIHTTRDVDSLWARDTAPVFAYAKPRAQELKRSSSESQSVHHDSQVVGMILSFNQWGKKNLPTTDSYFAGAACSILKVNQVLAPFVAEGGGIEVDGDGTLLATESAILNSNRNPGVDKLTMERYFHDTFGVEKTIWFSGASGYDITDDHVDGLARFASPGVVLLSRPFVRDESNPGGALDDYYDVKRKLKDQTDAKGRPIRVIDCESFVRVFRAAFQAKSDNFSVQEPDPAVLEDYGPNSGVTVSYVNYHVVNGAVIVAKFGDEGADANAANVLARQYPGRVIEQVHLHQLGIQGGGIHCATQQFFA